MADYELKRCPFCGGDVRFDKAYSYFRDSVIYCDGCDMVFTLDDCSASDDDIVRCVEQDEGLWRLLGRAEGFEGTIFVEEQDDE